MTRSASFVLAAALALPGCAALNTFDTFDYAREVGSREPTAYPKGIKGEVTIVWRFGSPDWVSQMCQPMGHALGDIHGCSMMDKKGKRCLVFAVEPTNFQDRNRLAVLGHEIWHCFGAKHA
jgi:hypothetical protein